MGERRTALGTTTIFEHLGNSHTHSHTSSLCKQTDFWHCLHQMVLLESIEHHLALIDCVHQATFHSLCVLQSISPPFVHKNRCLHNPSHWQTDVQWRVTHQMGPRQIHSFTNTTSKYWKGVPPSKPPPPTSQQHKNPARGTDIKINQMAD